MTQHVVSYYLCYDSKYIVWLGHNTYVLHRVSRCCIGRSVKIEEIATLVCEGQLVLLLIDWNYLRCKRCNYTVRLEHLNNNVNTIHLMSRDFICRLMRNLTISMKCFWRFVASSLVYSVIWIFQCLPSLSMVGRCIGGYQGILYHNLNT